MRFSRCYAFAFLMLVIPFSFAQYGAPIAPAYRAALRDMAQAMRSEEMAKAGFDQAIQSVSGGDPQGIAIMRDIMDDIKPGDVTEKLIPVYAKYYSREQAEQIARFYSTPAGNKIIDGVLKAFKTGRPFALKDIYFSRSEQLSITAFEKTSGARALAQSTAKVNAETGEIFRAWGQELALKKMRVAFAPIFSANDASSPAGDGAPVASGALAQAVAPLVVAAKQVRDVRVKFQSGLEQVGLTSILLPQKLVSKEGIADGKAKVRQVAVILDEYLRSIDETSENLRKTFNEIALPPAMKAQFLQGAEKGFARSYDENIRFGENQRNLIALYDRVLDFADTRFGKIALKDDHLEFADDADLETYRKIYAQVKVEVNQENALVSESQERRKALTQWFADPSKN